MTCIGRRRHLVQQRAKGFTLIEIMVVVMILGIAAAVAVVVLERDERGTLDREARRFAGALEYAAQRAQMRHETLGVSAGDGQWRFWLRASDGRWRVLADDEPLRARALPSTWRATPLAYSGQALPPDAIVPLRASGRNEPYAFELASERLRALVSGDPMNRVVITGPQPLPQ